MYVSIRIGTVVFNDITGTDINNLKLTHMAIFLKTPKAGQFSYLE
jgi:hypothetical protein